MRLPFEGSYKYERGFFDGFTLSILSSFASHEKPDSETWHIMKAGQRTPHKGSVPVCANSLVLLRHDGSCGRERSLADSPK